MQGSSDLWLTSLRSCSRLWYDNNVVEIAARVVEEFRAEKLRDYAAGTEFSDDGDDAFSFCGMENDETREAKDGVKVEEKNSDDDLDLEFAFAPTEMAFSPVWADEVFCNGQIRPIFPVGKRNLSIAEEAERNSNWSAVKARLPLRKLLSEGREIPPSEAEKLGSDPAVEEETYCVWEPKLGHYNYYDHHLSPPAPGGGSSTATATATATAGSSKWWKQLLSRPKRRY